MSTKTQLHVYDPQPNSYGRAGYYYRPPTHDELLAAMPRCRTCAHAPESSKKVKFAAGRWCKNFETIVMDDFACIEHKETPTHVNT